MSFSNGQQRFLNLANEGANIFLTGKAGTGKSFVVKYLINTLKESGKNVVAIAPTGIAANNIGGQTIHSMFNINPFGISTFETCNYLKGEKRRMLDKIDTIIIDEVSMLRPDIFDAMNYTLIKNGCSPLTSKQIIFVGDMKQLPAVLPDNERSILRLSYDGGEFMYSKIFHKLDVVEVDLDEVLRQTDEEFIHNLNIIREGGKSEYFRRFVSDAAEGIILAPHNSTVAMYNIEGLAKLTGNEIVFVAKIDGNLKAEDFNLETRVTVKNGAKIMYLQNSQNNNLVNGTIGIFRVIDGKYFIDVKGVDYSLEPIEVEKKKYVLSKDESRLELQTIGSITQYPIKLAYALTIHKSQGLTFDKVTIDLSRPCFSKGQMYTALSRVTSPNGLKIKL